MSLLKKLFGLGGSSPKASAPAPTLEHKGFTIAATPMVVGHEFQVCGVITKTVGETVREKSFIRVDRMSSKDDVIALIFQKGCQIIDQSGDRLFD